MGWWGKAGNAGGKRRAMDAGGEINSWFFNNVQCTQFTVFVYTERLKQHPQTKGNLLIAVLFFNILQQY